jgi:biotin carboxyl carrier protein
MTKHEIQSPLPGTFYRRSSPDAKPYKEVGDTVSASDVIGLIEVMKQFTELTADVAGTMAEFLVEDGDAVEPGQVIAVVAKSQP